MASEADPASRRIRHALLALAPWREEGRFASRPVLRHGDHALVTIPDEHLYRDGLDREFREATGGTADAVVYASRHRSAAGRKALTVHPIGNFGEATYGGRPGVLVPAAPAIQSALLRSLRSSSAGLRAEVTLECTHHGPWLETPTCYIEVGSDASGWEDAEAAAAVARAILGAAPRPGPVAVGFGGGHYVPRFTDRVAKGEFDLGHMASAHALEEVGIKAVDMAVAATPGATHALFHTRAAERGAHEALRARASQLGLVVIAAD